MLVVHDTLEALVAWLDINFVTISMILSTQYIQIWLRNWNNVTLDHSNFFLFSCGNFRIAIFEILTILFRISLGYTEKPLRLIYIYRKFANLYNLCKILLGNIFRIKIIVPLLTLSKIWLWIFGLLFHVSIMNLALYTTRIVQLLPWK